MLTRVDVENYRGFQSYSLAGLARVNLLVGKNNSGKTALLEAVQFAASAGHPSVLLDAARRRGELGPIQDDRLPDSSYLAPDLSHFFFGHQLVDQASFAIASDNGIGKLSVRANHAEEGRSPKLQFGNDREVPLGFRIAIECPRRRSEPRLTYGKDVDDERELIFDLLVNERGLVLSDPRFREPRIRPKSPLLTGLGDAKPTLFVPPESISHRQFATLWRRILIEAKQGLVVDSLRIVHPDVDQVIFLPADYSGFGTVLPSTTSVVVTTRGTDRPIPLGSMGDGMRRILGLSASLACADQGYLLVDEIDSGLHYSVMSEMWEVVVGSAIKSDVQIIATTHSLDCIKGLSQLCSRKPEIANNIALHKIDRETSTNVLFLGKEVVTAVAHDVELR